MTSGDGYGEVPRTGADAVQRPLATGLLVVGTLLILLGIGRALVVLGVLDEAVAEAFGTWWPLLPLGAGVWLAATGRRVTGVALALVAGALLVFRVLPAGYAGPVVLIGIGLLVLWGAAGGRRWVLGGGAVALFDDVTAGGDGSPPARSYVAVFGESQGRLDASLAGQGTVECMSVFGDVQIRVPRDVALQLSETAVFGDVRAPAPPSGSVAATIPVRATAVFGDVRFTRD